MAHYPTTIPPLPPLESGVNDNSAAGIAAASPLNDLDINAARLQHTTRKRLALANPAQALATPAKLMASKRRTHPVESAHFNGAATPEWAQVLRQQNQDLKQQLGQQHQELKQQNQDLNQQNQDLNQQNQDLNQQLQQQSQDLKQQNQDLKQQNQDLKQQLQQQNQDLKQQLQQQNQDLKQQLQQQNRNLRWLLQEESARSMNRSRRYTRDRIQPLIRTSDGIFPNAPQHNLWFPDDDHALNDATGAQVDALLQFYDLDTSGHVPERKERLKRHLQVIL